MTVTRWPHRHIVHLTEFDAPRTGWIAYTVQALAVTGVVLAIMWVFLVGV